MFVRVIAVETAKAKIAALRLTAFGIQLLHVDLAHIRAIGDVGFAVFGDDGLFVDPPISVGAFYLYFLATM